MPIAIKRFAWLDGQACPHALLRTAWITSSVRGKFRKIAWSRERTGSKDAEADSGGMSRGFLLRTEALKPSMTGCYFYSGDNVLGMASFTCYTPQPEVDKGEKGGAKRVTEI